MTDFWEVVGRIFVVIGSIVGLLITIGLIGLLALVYEVEIKALFAELRQRRQAKIMEREIRQHAGRGRK